MTEKIYIKKYETVRTEPDGECVAYYHEDEFNKLGRENTKLQERIIELEQRRDELQENNTKLVLENRQIRKQNMYYGTKNALLTGRIADLERQLAEARESAVG